MTPPEAPEDGSTAAARDQAPPAVSSCPGASGAAPTLETLRKRADFLAAARALHVAMPGFVLQLRVRKPGETPPGGLIRVGYTCSKKVGNAVARNRAKRRLREIARLVLPAVGRAGHDYVLIGRKGATAARDFQQLQRDLRQAVETLHARSTAPRSGRRS